MIREDGPEQVEALLHPVLSVVLLQHLEKPNVVVANKLFDPPDHTHWPRQGTSQEEHPQSSGSTSSFLSFGHQHQSVEIFG